jgi:hypothetical protein
MSKEKTEIFTHQRKKTAFFTVNEEQQMKVKETWFVKQKQHERDASEETAKKTNNLIRKRQIYHPSSIMCRGVQIKIIPKGVHYLQ